MTEFSTNYYILLVLSFIFPDGIGRMIFNFMKETEFEDARKEHMMDCVLYRAKEKIGDIVMGLIPLNYNFLGETLKHVDHNINHVNLNRQFYRALPHLRIIQRYESKYSDKNSINEHEISLQKSWRCNCIAFKILDNVLDNKRLSYAEILNLYPNTYNIFYGYHNGEYEYYNGILDYPVIRINEYLRKEDAIHELCEYWDRDSGIYKELLPYRIEHMKYEQSLKRKFKKNDSYKFKNKYFKNKNRVRSRKYGISGR